MIDCKTLTVPQAGASYFGLSRGASYEAAKRGEIPTIRIGKLLRVPVQALEEILASAKSKDTASGTI
jgi:excisionase family DNA binding protein